MILEICNNLLNLVEACILISFVLWLRFEVVPEVVRIFSNAEDTLENSVEEYDVFLKEYLKTQKKEDE